MPHIVTLSKGTKDVFQAIAVKDKACFVTEDNLFVLAQGQQNATDIRRTEATGSFINIFELFGMLFVNTEHGVFKIQNDKLVPFTLALPPGAQVSFSSHFENLYLLGLSDNRIYLCGENLKPRQLKLEDEAYANASVVVSARWVNQDMFALGTLRGGLMFVHASTGKTQEIINYTTGLPDNEVFALMTDKNQCIWAAHEYGFTRVAPYLPFRSFGHYPGLQGNLLCALSFDNEVYVGTSLGLYKLQKEEVYDEKIFYVENAAAPKKPITRPALQTKKTETVTAPGPVETQTPQVDAEQEAASKNQGFWRFLKRKRSKQAAAPATTTPVTVQSPESKPGQEASAEATAPVVESSSQGQKLKRTQKVLRSSQFV